MHVATNNTDPNHLIGKLCVGGDWACAHGDLDALRYVARCLADHTSGALHRELIALAVACYEAPDVAAASWVALRDRVRVAQSRGKMTSLDESKKLIARSRAARERYRIQHTSSK